MAWHDLLSSTAYFVAPSILARLGIPVQVMVHCMPQNPVHATSERATSEREQQLADATVHITNNTIVCCVFNVKLQ